ncbi:MAG TPA: RDD family protein [Thermoplasmata archaeon]|nr:RDD family protein [Thermoplasmata archaeon]
MSTPSLPAPSRPGFSLPPPPPPGFAYQYRYAGLLARFGAVILDFLLLLVVTIVIAIPLGILAFVATVAGAPGDWVGSFVWGPFALLMFLLWIGYFTYFESTSGQTPGKRALGIRVVSVATARPPDLGHALVRNIFRVIDWLPGLYFVGFVVAALTSRKQRLGDLLADTIVVAA